MEEAIVELLGRLSNISDTGLLNQLRRLLKSIVRAIKAIYSGSITMELPETLDPNTTIAELSKMITDGGIELEQTLDTKIDKEAKSFLGSRIDAFNQVFSNDYKITPTVNK